MASRSEPAVSGWAVGFAMFGGAIMLMVGIFSVFAGIAAIFNDEFFVVGRNYTYDLDVTAWGWVHLVVGVVIAFAGISVYSGATWARTVGVVLAIISAVTNFFFIPYYPVWSVLIIALDIAVIWALTQYGPEQAAARG